MSWQTRGTSFTNPAYYRDAADSVEAQLRADFSAHHQLGEIAAYGETPAQVVEYKARAHNIARQWLQDAAPEHQQLWHELAGAVEAWTANPEAARREFGQLQQSFIEGGAGIDSNTIRTQRQAAELTGHLEPVNDRSAQDGARWRPRHLSVVPDPGVEATRSDSLVDRALGGRATQELSMAEVEAIINGSDELLAAEEALADLDTGEDEITALLPAAQRNAYLTPTVTIDQVPAQIGAVRRVQDLAAQHARLAAEFDESPEGSQVRIDQLERLMDGARDARRAAALAGADHDEITGAYQAGLAGHYWSQQPGAPRLAQLEHVLGERDTAVAELDALRSQLGLAPDYPPALALAAGAENTHPAPNTAPPGGAVMSSAVEAALPEADPAADWASPELTGVIDAPRYAPGIDPQF
ncbi:hypothetical protein NN3_00590 [Nocardia neocaledoniensis NBRC 108232]|uniref:Uncharacterized protein n=1 Tax=Nocardia neocaledoniensis TaxID=236511 RepID=A0A317NH69_9NOCA|nr:hypothetical protein [Nocardia neocaledoniensis]PWV74452.1 hypothetical protein DFR69_106263 [Nocardia neocaledoniensis]GEM29052.1 hypothetical protein NN3_00590 [Nocardia neocaledoniensis NBRC 108232]